MSTLVLSPLDRFTNPFHAVYSRSALVDQPPLRYLRTIPRSYPQIVDGTGTITVRFRELVGFSDERPLFLFDVTTGDGGIQLHSYFHCPPVRVEKVRLYGYTIASTREGYTFSSTIDDTVITVDRFSVTITTPEAVTRWTPGTVTTTDRHTGMITETTA